MLTFNKLQRFLQVCGLLVVSGGSLNAQSIIPPHNPDNPLANITVVDPYVNADMLTTPSGPLRIVAWHNGNNETEVRLWDNTGGIATDIMTNARFTDVALADDVTSPGDYIATFVFKKNNDTYLQTYNITGVGTSSITYSLANTVYVSNSGGFPYIDMFADQNMIINGLPAMHEFVFTWGVYDPLTSSIVLYASRGDVQTPNTYDSTLIPTASSSCVADVAASTDMSSNILYAYCAVHDNVAGTLDLVTVDYSASPVSTATTALSTAKPYISRIEAQGLYNPGMSNDPWSIVSPLWNTTTSAYELNLFNSTNITGFNCTPTGSVLAGHNWCAAIASGLGSQYPGPFGNDNFVAGWHARTNNIFVTQAIDVTTGNINTAIPDYYQINSIPLGPFLPGKISLALTSTSNAGKEMLSVWYDGNNNIFYKETTDIMSYKPTDISTISRNEDLMLYPNPAESGVMIKAGKGITFENLRIYNTLGKVVYQNPAPASGAFINLNGFASGMYQVVFDTPKGKVSRQLVIK